MSALDAFRWALPTSGLTPVDIVCFGDSITEGTAALAHEAGWPALTRDLVRARCMSGSTKGGSGYVAANYATTGIPPAWAVTGAVETGTLSTGLGCRMLKVVNGSSISLTFQGTGIDVLHTSGIHAYFEYQFDGGSWWPVDARVSGVNSGNVVQIHNRCDGQHVLNVRGTANGSGYIEGAMVYRGDEAAGVRVWEGGHSGFMASSFNATTRWQGSFLAVPNPRLAVVSLGINEYSTGVPVATFTSDLDELLTTLTTLLAGRACSVLVMMEHARLPVSGSPDWSLYEDGAATVAANHGAGFLKQSDVIGDPAAAVAAGLIQTGTGLHPTASGHAKYATALAGYVLP